jgi:predicted transposase/invertase (TIGR01784 family)
LKDIRKYAIKEEGAGIFMEVGKMRNGTLTFDDVLVELGLTTKWKAEGWEKGLEEGLEKGLEKGREEVARNALAKGLPLDTIGEITGLDIETIKSFASQ